MRLVKKNLTAQTIKALRPVYFSGSGRALFKKTASTITAFADSVLSDRTHCSIKNRLERRVILNREIGKNLAVDLDSVSVQPVYESGIRNPVHPRGGVDSRYP